MDAPLHEPLDTSGLTAEQAASRLAEFGFNETGSGKRSTVARCSLSSETRSPSCSSSRAGCLRCSGK